MITSGVQISNGYTSGESVNFAVTSTNTYVDSPEYHKVLWAFDTGRSQTGNYASYFYWLSSNDNQTLTLTFKNTLSVQKISKMTFNPYPNHSFADRRLSTGFTVAFYDENNILIYQMTITPITARNTVQTVWFEDFGYKKSVVFYDKNYSYFNKVDKSMIPMSSKYPTTKELIHGMDDLQSITTRAVSELKPMSMEYGIYNSRQDFQYFIEPEKVFKNKKVCDKVITEDCHV
ncbi:hypothetical protein [Lysinibacillus fusiformis]|uniref:hypothetical protein n=1 Tax=Lysinibacillus fusiformis TaxID=28031 RepID=UPI000469C72B|nr:hypothetical protein [Lysinibacillus fusiformis]